MANCISALYADFAVPATITAANEHSALPASNLLSVTTPNWPWRGGSAISLSDWILVDFGAAVTLPAIVLDNINIGSVILKGKNADESWGSPSWTSGTKTVTRDGKSRRKLWLQPSGSGSPFNYRYLRIEPGTTTTTDGSAFWWLGTVLGLKVITEWPQNFGFPWTPRHRQSLNPGLRTGGGGTPSRHGALHAEITIPESRWDNPAMEAVIDGILSQPADPIVLYRNFGNDAEVYLGHITNEPAGPSQVRAHTLQAGPFVLRECV